jgi:hypothetical protein
MPYYTAKCLKTDDDIFKFRPEHVSVHVIQICNLAWVQLVFESPVRSGFLPFLGGNRGPDRFIYF